MFRRILISMLLVVAMCLVACGGEDNAKDLRPPSNDGDTDTDSDSDGDSDSDSDSDGDSDSDIDGDSDTDTDGDTDSDGDTDEDTSTPGTDKEMKMMWKCLICGDEDVQEDELQGE